MFLNSYYYKYGVADGDSVLVEGVDRDALTYLSYKKYTDEYTSTVKPLGSTQALIIIGGPMAQHSDMRNIENTSRDFGLAIKTMIGTSLYQIARMFKNFKFQYATVDAHTCVSGLSAVHTARKLIEDGYTDVIVYGAELVEESLKLLFRQLGIELVCGDGVICMHFSSNKSNILISDSEFLWNMDTSPMSVSKEGYDRILECFDKNVDLVKTHGSGTARNTLVENEAVKDALGDIKIVAYKDEIGHTQGVSGAIELCMMIDREEFNKAIVLASGLGGFYAGCVVERI